MALSAREEVLAVPCVRVLVWRSWKPSSPPSEESDELLRLRRCQLPLDVTPKLTVGFAVVLLSGGPARVIGGSTTSCCVLPLVAEVFSETALARVAAREDVLRGEFPLIVGVVEIGDPGDPEAGNGEGSASWVQLVAGDMEVKLAGSKSSSLCVAEKVALSSLGLRFEVRTR